MNFLKRSMVIFAGVFIIVSSLSVMPAQASTENCFDSVKTQKYDLMKGGTQKLVIEDSDGENIEIVITELEKISRMDNGEYKVEFSKPLSWKAGFYISVKGDKINSAYSPYYTVYLGGYIYNDILVKNNTSQVTYRFTYNKLSNYINTGVCAKIEKNNLSVSML